MSVKKRFIETVKRKLDIWKHEVERLQADADRIESHDMRQYSEVVQAIIARIQRVENQFVNDDHLSPDTWKSLKLRFEADLQEIDERIRQARKKFKGLRQPLTNTIQTCRQSMGDENGDNGHF